MRRSLPAILAFPLILAAGYVHGRLTDRWTASRSSAAAVASIARLPMDLGSWHGQVQELDRAVIERGGIAGYAARRYVDARTGAAVSILLVCGRPGPIAAHTPEVCYPGAGYEQRGEAERRAVRVGPSGPPSEFLACTFARPAAPDSPEIGILWAWNGGAGWETSESPRLSFARHPNLYKLYVVVERRAQSSEDPSAAFLEVLLPALKATLA